MVVRPYDQPYGRQCRGSGHTLRPISTEPTHDQRTWPIHNQHIVSYNQHTTTPIPTNLWPIFQTNVGHTLQPHWLQPTYDQYPRGNNNQWNVITANHTTNTLFPDQSYGQVATNLTTTFQIEWCTTNYKATILISSLISIFTTISYWIYNSLTR